MKRKKKKTVCWRRHWQSASVLPMASKVATELDVLDIISRAGPGAYLSASEMALHLHTENPDAATMLDCQPGWNVASTHVSTGSDKLLMDSWYHLRDAILEGGIPFDKAQGMTIFKYCEKDSKYNKFFIRGMSGHTTTVMVLKKILDTYKGFEGLKDVVDVGGGNGLTLKMITSRYPQIKGMNFDLLHVVEEAPSYPDKNGLT
uniref:O-methyltransferase C-terminal domain-containing protein n=1 Tax=Nelumbo nucifera TaxID=4432 RepID=A0A822Z6E7_NELNU|nr:TPA_asm: hypothetical protein HUJ06_016257 [Nelumbo nucifera]DAD41940.1 TPA_asm: hypothetical protein HUJ06_016263 [Nelumbo nucifera]DAD41954.1 TPA_asm: hypothetical protein HUJ06_016277 [Nelumbo nucifera]